MNRSRGGFGMVMVTLVLALVSAMAWSGPTLPAQSPVVATTDEMRMTRTAEALLARPVTVDLDGVSLRQAVMAVAARGGIKVQYRYEVLDAYRTSVTLHVKQAALGSVFAQLFAATPLRLVAGDGEHFIIIRAAGNQTAAVSGVITGHVTDGRTKQPLRGAKVGLDGIERVTETGEDGTFRVADVAAGSHTVTVKLLGYRKIVQTVVVTEGAVTTVSVVLESSANTLEQVVVTGTVIPTELKALPNAITVITAKDIEQRGITHIDQLFRGDVPGLFVQNQGSATNLLDGVMMFSRGATAFTYGRSAGTLDGTNPIKTYVDGVEMADPRYLSQIDPKNIERIEILTGPQASTIYGSNALNGVMQIFTKRGTSNTPQLTFNLLSGWIENNFSTAHAPQHDYSAQIAGLDGHLSYNAGTSWNYTGQWTTGQQSTRTGGFGGARGEWHALVGMTTADVTLRRTVTEDLQRGNQGQPDNDLSATGYKVVQLATGRSAPATRKLEGQTLGLTLGYRPTTWWSHSLVLGQDAEATQFYTTAPGYFNGSSGDDTLLSYGTGSNTKRSIGYTTTAQMPVASLAVVTATLGADAWQSLATDVTAQPTKLIGDLANADVTRKTSHNTGGFVQTQLAVRDQLFLTYGLRAEWNPAFGKNIEPNMAPRYGLAYTHELGVLTAKVRASYGRSTRPPTIRAVQGRQLSASDYRVPFFGPYWYVLPNPDILPEHQKGGEGGLELYLGTRGSLVVTRYNQTVDNLIDFPLVDSVRSLQPDPFGDCADNPSSYDAACYAYAGQFQYANLGSIRNQGWELQGSVNTGPFTTKGTYSWTKSRVIGITPAFAAQFPASDYPQYQKGATFQYLAEHTWAMNVTYAQHGSTIALNVNGIGQLRTDINELRALHVSGAVRLLQNRYRINIPGTYNDADNGYALADLNAAQRFSARLEGVLQLQNLMNRYRNDVGVGFASMGRQGKIGLRVRF